MSCFWNAWTKMNSVKFRQTGQGKTELYTEKSSTYFSKEEKMTISTNVVNLTT